MIKYRSDIDKLSDDELKSDEELCLLREETKTFIRETCSQIQVKGQLRSPHRLITEHKEEIVYRKKRDKALKQASSNSTYYANVKSKYRENNPVIPICISEFNLNRAYRILNALINTLDGMEANIRVGQASGKEMVKRVIGLPNDKVEIDSDGKVFVNNQKLNETYINYPDNISGSFKVPEGEYFFLGDFRAHSFDSRKWENPFIPEDKILGEAKFILFPFNRMSMLE